MAQRINDTFVFNAGGAVVYLARIQGADGANITIATITSIARFITDTKTKVVVEDAITVDGTGDEGVSDTLQTDTNLWDQSYNFKDTIVATKLPNRRKYLLQYTFTPTDATLVFKTREIDLEGD